ncbi:uncharacterized protein AMSG_12081 [Thecamonas trahens ATCC 50062]|uniref:Uncharacterized protein n=1 Tax=Thecamonas trahens ATCC 50062 TaxID=461836 RepID=A0A0L0DGU0_THETB|nr:hypothetical protein AMSG_12081 [Thecamonas trahens ATCC 50062]KNC51415.1 hypothetical protein AMSG_12081 [Thecamonas trahens ATCC 50062]|eukprot:XP_013756161.1 hypothetical protein AMSG_12081 [Thecamonas trahens ATCC 50062]
MTDRKSPRFAHTWMKRARIITSDVASCSPFTARRDLEADVTSLGRLRHEHGHARAHAHEPQHAHGHAHDEDVLPHRHLRDIAVQRLGPQLGRQVLGRRSGRLLPHGLLRAAFGLQAHPRQHARAGRQGGRRRARRGSGPHCALGCSAAAGRLPHLPACCRLHPHACGHDLQHGPVFRHPRRRLCRLPRLPPTRRRRPCSG